MENLGGLQKNILSYFLYDTVYTFIKTHWIGIIIIIIFVSIVIYKAVESYYSDEGYVIDRTDLINSLVSIKDDLPVKFTIKDVKDALRYKASSDEVDTLLNAFDSEIYYKFKQLYDKNDVTVKNLWNALK